MIGGRDLHTSNQSQRSLSRFHPFTRRLATKNYTCDLFSSIVAIVPFQIRRYTFAPGTSTGESCLICEQNAAYVASLSQDNKEPEYDLFYEELPPDESPDHLSLAELRTLHVNHFDDSADLNNLVIKVNRLKIKEDLIKEFQKDIVSFILFQHSWGTVSLFKVPRNLKKLGRIVNAELCAFHV